MSEQINNREYRQKKLKELILELHKGKTVEEVKPEFEKLIQGISVGEISEMEQALIMEGMPVEEIQRLCDVHAAVFKGSIMDIHRPTRAEDTPGHPIHTLKRENKEIEKLINDKIMPHIEEYINQASADSTNKLLEDFKLLLEIDKHYSKKENLIFPYLEKYGITAPPKVMWGVDDEIRAAIKEVVSLLPQEGADRNVVAEKAKLAADRVTEMIYKEEKILFPMTLETLTEDEWVKISEESEEIGFCLIEPVGKWSPVYSVEPEATPQGEGETTGYVRFDAGILTPEEINAIFNTLPVDVTFVDKNDSVKFFSQPKDRIFARPKTVIGRKVQNCHPPASVHIVEKIVDDFKTGKKDHEDFWIRMGGKYVFIRYFAVRDANGNYLGTLEVTQDIAPIQQLQGKRLLSE